MARPHTHARDFSAAKGATASESPTQLADTVAGISGASARTGSGLSDTAAGAALSKIFDWYKEDFGGDGGVLVFLKKYRSGKSDFKKISYQDYDWGLNETK